jgi:hypothetical protein
VADVGVLSLMNGGSTPMFAVQICKHTGEW